MLERPRFSALRVMLGRPPSHVCASPRAPVRRTPVQRFRGAAHHARTECVEDVRVMPRWLSTNSGIGDTDADQIALADPRLPAARAATAASNCRISFSRPPSNCTGSVQQAPDSRMQIRNTNAERLVVELDAYHRAIAFVQTQQCALAPNSALLDAHSQPDALPQVRERTRVDIALMRICDNS